MAWKTFSLPKKIPRQKDHANSLSATKSSPFLFLSFFFKTSRQKRKTGDTEVISRSGSPSRGFISLRPSQMNAFFSVNQIPKMGKKGIFFLYGMPYLVVFFEQRAFLLHLFVVCCGLISVAALALVAGAGTAVPIVPLSLLLALENGRERENSQTLEQEHTSLSF